MTAAAHSLNWESELASLLKRLSIAQQELLALLAMKRELIVRRDHRALEELAPREGDLAAELQACHQRRQELLALAEAEGLPGNSLQDLAQAFPKSTASALQAPVAEARRRAELIRHECLTQWVVVQRTVLHLSQLLEIIATGGRLQPTYGKGCVADRGGSLIDQAV